MPAVPRRIVNQITSGQKRSNEWRTWLTTAAPENVQRHVKAAMKNGLSLEWAILTAANRDDL